MQVSSLGIEEATWIFVEKMACLQGDVAAGWHTCL